LSVGTAEGHKRWDAALTTLLALWALPAQAQSDFPTRPTRIIVGFLPASSNDLLARFVGSKLTIGTILREPETAQRLAAAGAQPWMLSSAEFARVIRSEIQKRTRVSRESHSRAE
jgi:tripartite-type tricarboxylate transporter receptor subunit TctC